MNTIHHFLQCLPFGDQRFIGCNALKESLRAEYSSFDSISTIGLFPEFEFSSLFFSSTFVCSVTLYLLFIGIRIKITSLRFESNLYCGWCLYDLYFVFIVMMSWLVLEILILLLRLSMKWNYNNTRITDYWLPIYNWFDCLSTLFSLNSLQFNTCHIVKEDVFMSRFVMCSMCLVCCLFCDEMWCTPFDGHSHFRSLGFINIASWRMETVSLLDSLCAVHW